jgi:glycosyltransferase involved in cell wall biosynthesis
VAMTVVIPSHQEAAVIGACLSSLVRQDCDEAVQVIVVANGCDDATAAIARGYVHAMAQRGFALEVQEIAQASKRVALDAGDRSARHGDRVYLDADVELSGNALSSIAAAFAAGVQFCAPQIVPQAQTYFGRAYARVWPRLPYIAGDVVGAGMYAVSARGRARWDCFPRILADDKFARLQFDRSERHVLEQARFTMPVPDGFRELVRVRSRWIRASRQLRREFPHLAAHDRERLVGLPRFILANASLWRDLPPFALVYSCAMVRSWLTEIGSPRSRARWERASRARDARQAS